VHDGGRAGVLAARPATPADLARALTPEQGEELLAIVLQKEPWSATQQARWEELVEQAADAPGLYERLRQEAAIAAREKALAEEARVQAMPMRTFTGRGGAYVPGHAFAWLMSPKDGSMDVIDVGVLVTLQICFENRTACPFLGGEVVEGGFLLSAGYGYALARPLDAAGDLSWARARGGQLPGEWLGQGLDCGRESLHAPRRAAGQDAGGCDRRIVTCFSAGRRPRGRLPGRRAIGRAAGRQGQQQVGALVP